MYRCNVIISGNDFLGEEAVGLNG